MSETINLEIVVVANNESFRTGCLLHKPQLITEGVTITLVEELFLKKKGIPKPYTFLLAISTVTANCVTIADWIERHFLQAEVKRITIDKTEIEFDKGQIKRILTEKISGGG